MKVLMRDLDNGGDTSSLTMGPFREGGRWLEEPVVNAFESALEPESFDRFRVLLDMVR